MHKVTKVNKLKSISLAPFYQSKPGIIFWGARLFRISKKALVVFFKPLKPFMVPSYSFVLICPSVAFKEEALASFLLEAAEFLLKSAGFDQEADTVYFCRI